MNSFSLGIRTKLIQVTREKSMRHLLLLNPIAFAISMVFATEYMSVPDTFLVP